MASVVGGGSVLIKEKSEGFVSPVVTEVERGSGDLSSRVSMWGGWWSRPVVVVSVVADSGGWV